MNFCTNCGAKLSLAIPPGDNLPRHICENCATIHYQNPKNVVGSIPVWKDQILLCRRSIQPRSGYWTLPAGFMENGETLKQAAAREAKEEALANLKVGDLFSAISVLHVNQVHIMFLADLLDGEFGVGEESSDTKLVTPEQIPWDDLAFPSVEFTLRRYVDDLVKGCFGVHMTTIERRIPRTP